MRQDEAVLELAKAIEHFAGAYGLTFREALQVIADEQVNWGYEGNELWLSALEACNRLPRRADYTVQMGREPNQMFEAAKHHMLDDNEPKTHEDWQLVMNFFAANIDPQIAITGCKLMSVSFSNTTT